MWKNDFCAECEKTVELLINYCRFDDIVGVFDTTKECDYILVRLLDKTSLCMPKRKLKEDSMIKVFLWSSLFFVFVHVLYFYLLVFFCSFFFFKQKTGYGVCLSFVGSGMCIRDRLSTKRNAVVVKVKQPRR